MYFEIAFRRGFVVALFTLVQYIISWSFLRTLMRKGRMFLNDACILGFVFALFAVMPNNTYIMNKGHMCLEIACLLEFAVAFFTLMPHHTNIMFIGHMCLDTACILGFVVAFFTLMPHNIPTLPYISKNSGKLYGLSKCLASRLDKNMRAK